MEQFVLGVAASILAAILFPAITDCFWWVFVRLFGWLPTKGKTNLSGQWSSTWYVKSERFPENNTDENSIIRQIGRRVFLEHNAGDVKFGAKGIIEGGRYVTGVWYDQTDAGYHGAFQLIIDPQTKNMAGQWVGYSTSGVVKNGDWVWHKNK